MAIVPWKPFKDLDKWFEEDWRELWEFPERIIAPFSELRTPRMDVYEENGNIVAEVELPGVDPKNIDVEVKDNYLKVEAKKEEKKEEKKKGYYRKEISRGYYRRIIPLPEAVKGEKADASYKDGILKIVIPKLEEKKEKKGVKVKVKKS